MKTTPASSLFSDHPAILALLLREATEARVYALIGILFAGRWKLAEAKGMGCQAIERLVLIVEATAKRGAATSLEGHRPDVEPQGGAS